MLFKNAYRSEILNLFTLTHTITIIIKDKFAYPLNTMKFK